jgi:hypothetical protein
MIKPLNVLFLSAVLLEADTTNRVSQELPAEIRIIATLDLIDGDLLVDVEDLDMDQEYDEVHSLAGLVGSCWE